jgi:catechol 2,3-dioxygenase-like lactoylglutathione lyase family enzyme
MMKVLAFDHIQIAMPTGEEAKARAFYGDVLGMTEILKPPALAQRGGAWFRAGDVVIHLGVEADFRPARKAHPALLVDDLDGFLGKCRELGIEIDPTQPPLEGYRRAHVFDPFGNRVELMERIP